MLANISTPPTPSVTAWLRCTIRAARPPASPSMSVAVHSGREMSSGDCRATSARSITSRRVPGSATRTRRTWKSRLKSGSMTQRGAAVGSVGITTFCRSRSTFRDALSNRAPEPLPVRRGVENLQRHDPRAGARVGFAAVQYLVDGAEFLRGSGRVQFRHVAHGCGHPDIVAALPSARTLHYPR